ARMRADVKALDSYDAKKAAALFEKFVKNQTWQCPTLTVLRSSAYLDDNRFTSDGRIRYMPMQIRNRWIQRVNSINRDFSDQKRVFQKEILIVGAMNRARVPIIAGTDTGNPFCFPGFSLHDELALLVIAGLSPMEALQTATINPAKYLGMEQSLGSIEKGKLADIVLLDADPLQEIKNTQKIDSVIENGRLYDRKALNRMLSEAEGRAGIR
ncbi:MAG TPA: amidohydrolase family protein, partial [Blastocatellia bacterium]|nr:amidohydrolase family protein [Blastocatellia bacterium]